MFDDATLTEEQRQVQPSTDTIFKSPFFPSLSQLVDKAHGYDELASMLLEQGISVRNEDPGAHKCVITLAVVSSLPSLPFALVDSRVDWRWTM